jgi:tetraacyldisaccharide 4'-kinase
MNLIEKSWYKKFGFSWLFLPLSAIFLLVVKYRFKRYRKRQSNDEQPKVIVVGNITVGGTGKTPFTLFLVEYLSQKGLKVGVISRGYGGETQHQPLLVDETVSASISGDEPKLIALRTGVPVAVCPNRNDSLQYLKKHYQLDVIIADDGLQHYAMARLIELCIVDAKRAFGNRLVLPAGPLREPVSRLRSVDLTIYNGGTDNNSYQLISDGIYQVQNNVLASDFAHDVTLVSAIGNPSRFEQSVRDLALRVKSHKIFSDHHNFSQADFDSLSGPILMTEKDAVKCQSFAKDNWYYLKVSAKPSASLYNTLNQLFQNKGVT